MNFQFAKQLGLNLPMPLLGRADVVSPLLANINMARIACALLAKGGTDRAPALAAAA